MILSRAASLDPRDRHSELEHTPGQAVREPHPHAAETTAAGDRLLGGAPSPLWWSAPQRLVCAAVLVALLWLVIGWATD